jgi:hypothetical protein
MFGLFNSIVSFLDAVASATMRLMNNEEEVAEANHQGPV